MTRRQKFVAAAASLALGIVGLASAGTASGSTIVTLANCQSGLNGQTITFPTGSTSITITFTANTCDVVTPAADADGVITNPNLILSTTASPPQPGGGSSSVPPYQIAGAIQLNVPTTGTPATAQINGQKAMGSGGGPIPDGSYTVYFGYFTAAPTTYHGSFTVVIGGNSDGGGGSSSPTANAPQTFEFSLSPNDGTVCAQASEAGTAGAWISLPATGDCTPPATKVSSKLLGWATSPDFPVAIAKRQVDNGWGAYETFNDEGQLTSVFIPAGGSTLVSAAGNLFAIWSD